MSRSIRGKLERLEGRANVERCRECRLRPTSTYVAYPGEENHTPPEPEYCPSCGGLIETVAIRVVYEDE
jgi:rubrerythrin